ncbi:MAG TPA: class I SAM-dependent methyltransferase [Gemmatimonadaceae bacterium]|nr:class I SAM-dependent methyltransferase [Gemmatimonadaceae bacterium]
MTEIENISDTARWVAVYRAMETARPDAIFRDPFAARLAGERGNAIVDSMKRGRAMAWAMIVRTSVFDEIILDRIRIGGVDTVLNLAAGLDARAWRMKMPASLRWIDVDLPGILDYKTEILKDEQPVCRYEAIRLDLTDAPKRQALLSQIGRESSRVLVVTEGLLIYLTPEQVGSLARDLHAPSTFQWWLIDIANPRLLAMMSKMWGQNLNAGNAPFQFGPAEGTRFFDEFGWNELEFRSSMEEARRLKREMSMMWLWRFLGRMRSKEVQADFRRMSGTVLLERG